MDPEERKLIIELSKRGFLPKGIDKEPVIVEALLEETMRNAPRKQLSTEL